VTSVIRTNVKPGSYDRLTLSDWIRNQLVFRGFAQYTKNSFMGCEYMKMAYVCQDNLSLLELIGMNGCQGSHDLSRRAA
jgi:hypothetical protein